MKRTTCKTSLTRTAEAYHMKKDKVWTTFEIYGKAQNGCEKAVHVIPFITYNI